MKIKLLTISSKVPTWVNEGYQEYAKRLSDCPLELIEIPLEKRTKSSNIIKLKAKEAEKILTKIKPDDWIITLDVLGENWDTFKLAENLKSWRINARNVVMIIGGPDGIDESLLKRARLKWSLSPLTLPHQLVRIMIAEQLYRAASILQGHPYHR